MSNIVSVTGINTSQLPKLKNNDLVELLKKVKSGDEFARDEFIIANLRLVLSVVQRFGRKQGKADDMFQVGCVGLIKAMENFNMDLNVRFSTYAVPMIIGEIRRYLRDNNPVRVTRSLRDIAYRALQSREKLSASSNVEPTIDEIAIDMNEDLKMVTIALDAISDTVSLSDPAYSSNEESVQVMDQVPDPKYDVESLIEQFALRDALVNLSPREKEIIMMRYYIGKTQMEVSEEIGISQAQVSRLEKNALDSIKKKIT
ncbi:MAG: sigma-70 family RNA polymerase sigma factor [Clostridia bacterium]|nr:sigma-70 family RNA polymerase sigma factor [Clostridia bacterium]